MHTRMYVCIAEGTAYCCLVVVVVGAGFWEFLGASFGGVFADILIPIVATEASSP